MLSGKTGPPEHSLAVWCSPAALQREYLVPDGRTWAHGGRHRSGAGSVGAVGTRRSSGVRSVGGGSADSAEGAGPGGGHADPGAGNRAARQQVPLALRSVEQIATGSDVQDIEAQLPAAAEWIRGRLMGTTQALASSPSANALATLADSWRVTRSRLATWNDTLTRRATQLAQGAEQLEVMRTTWSASRATALESRAPAPVIERIDATLVAIVTAQRGAAERLTHVLGVQDRVVREIARCDDVLSRIAQAGATLAGPLFSRDSFPIWSPEARTLISTDLGGRLRESVGDSVELTREFLAGQLARVPLQ